MLDFSLRRERLALIAAVVAAVGILFLINRIGGHVRFLPLLAHMTLLYAIGKELHLSPLVLTTTALTAFAHHGEPQDVGAVEPIA